MDPETSRKIRAWLEREVALGLEVVPSSQSPAPNPQRSSAGTLERPWTGTPQRPSAYTPPTGEPQAPAVQPAVSAGISTAGDAPAASGSKLSELLVEPAVRSATTLDELRAALGECERCKLCRGRTNIVFGVGDPAARLMFVGEGPGEDEDRAGKPFVGKAGGLLDDIITKGMGLRRDDVYIANVVKCRPPNNRNPEPDEIVACEPFLRRQIELVRPELIVSLGNVATQALRGDRTPISRRRGRWHEVGGVALMPTFHPAYLLRNPSDKRLVWDDIKLVMARLGLALPQRGQP